MQPKAPKTSTKTHRRSRTGCFTCRLRRKKCDEGKPLCKACKHLGLSCEYKRPIWWGNVDQRKRQKENIKLLIKRTKLSEKVAQISPINSMARRRSLSMESGLSLEEEMGDYSELVNPEIHHAMHQYPYNPFTPFDLDIVTEKQPFVGTFPMPMRRNSTSTASYTSSNMGRNSVGDVMVPTEAFGQLDSVNSHVHHPDSCASTEDGLPGTAEFLFDFGPGYDQQEPPMPYIPADENERYLLNHFLDNVLPIIFPILDLHVDARQDVILPALAANECYRKCCLSIAALHLKVTQGLQGEWIDQDITRYRYATISGLCDALARDQDHLQILEATLGMILFQCSVGSPDDSLPDIPWHQHFQAVTNLVNKLDLTRFLQHISQENLSIPSVNMTLTAWVDILGATMLGRNPQFADAYREQHLSNGISGLRELMGCDDRVMYLISEIACLEALKNDGMLSDIDLCEHVKSLAHQIDLTESAMDQPSSTAPIITASGQTDTRRLTNATTDAFRFAARIYLCSLVPGFDRHQPQVMELLNKLTICLESIPAGPDGFDRSLVWVYLIGGSVATSGSLFMNLFKGRCAALGEASGCGSFGRMARILEILWARRESGWNGSWRDVMQGNAWDFLLI